MVEECIESSMPLARGKQVKLEKDIPLELPPLDGDRRRSSRCCSNLLSNAIKFTRSGPVLVRSGRSRGDARARADTGIGIRQDDLARLFEPFQRLDNPLARQAGGTGLGLAISKKFVELHGVASGRRAARTRARRSTSRCP